MKLGLAVLPLSLPVTVFMKTHRLISGRFASLRMSRVCDSCRSVASALDSASASPSACYRGRVLGRLALIDGFWYVCMYVCMYTMEIRIS